MKFLSQNYDEYYETKQNFIWIIFDSDKVSFKGSPYYIDLFFLEENE